MPSPPDGTSTPPASVVSSAIVTVPNIISFVRLLLMPVCAWLLASGRFTAGIWLTAAVGTTDWVDGWLARRTGSVSRLGQLLDPLADRLLIGSVAVALLVRGVLPWPAVALLVGRDLVLLVGFQVLVRAGVRPPEVIWLGKAATFALLVALPALAIGELSGGWAVWLARAGIVLLWIGVVLYLVVGVVYVRRAVLLLRARRSARPVGPERRVS